MLSNLKIKANAVGTGTFILNDVDVSHIVNGVRISMDSSDREVNQILLSLSPGDVDLDIDGLPHIVDHAAVVIDELDPKHIESKALARMGLDGDTDNLTEAILLTVKEMIHGS